MGILSITLGVLRRFTGGIDPILKNWFAGMNTPPSKDVQKIFNTYFIDYRETIDETEYRLKDIIAKADVLYFPVINNSNDSWRNIAKNDHHGTIEGAGLVFDPYFGFSNPNGTGYIDTHFNPSTQGVRYTLNDAGIGVCLFNSNTQLTVGYAIGVINTVQCGFRVDTQTYYLNSNSGDVVSDVPFKGGFRLIKRTANNSVAHVNQNMPNSTSNTTSSSIPNGNISIFNLTNRSYYFIGGINFVYIGASLTDAEFTTLNNAVNDYLIQCLFLKYGEDNWGVKMAKSYFYDLHGFEKYEAWEVYEFIKRMQPDYVGFTPVNLVPAASSSFETDGTAWWTVNRGTKQYNASTKDLTVIGDGVTPASALTIIRSSFLTIGKTYKVTFRAKSSNYTGQIIISESGSDAKYLGAVSTAYQNYIGYITPINTGNFRIEITNSTLGLEFTIDNIVIEEWIESDIVTFNKCLNSGFGNATDWINPTNGLAENWYSDLPTLDSPRSIVSGNGFKGNAQRIERARTTGHLYLYPVGLNVVVIGKSYTLYLKYRSNIPIALYNLSGAKYSDIGLANTGNATEASITFIANKERLYIGMWNVPVGSYFEIDEVCIIDNCNSQFYYNFFGPNGLNKQVCDWMMLFKAGGNLIANPWSKTGALLRWNQDGSIANSNTMPAYTRGSNLGIVTLSSVDGFDLLTQVETYQTSASVNSFYGNFPNIVGVLKKSGKLILNIRTGRFKNDLRNANIKDYVASCTLTTISYPGYQKIDLSKFVGGSFDWIEIGNTYTVTDIQGDVTDFNFAPTLFYCYNNYNVYGSLRNLSTSRLAYGIFVQYTSITEGTSSWNRNANILSMASCKLSTQAILDQLTVQKNQFAITPPIKNLTDNFSGTTMGIVPANHQLILDIIAQHAAAGYTATITVRTS